eukprot:CAMPEP_0174732144 /NCGR_PEP_ID=MMETSP1094-20130205/58862_1 /TAXON_ID=156173 /ORGANISM="Chrysochromulina brevifilum, Strain UTEX LB 985" /LENGTH=119 /DNA_ID=CAMNT_0015934621 /DNA_START=93 /DNA_END=448 /DNA_ORIENTATION=-
MPTQQVRTRELGCKDDKTVCLYERSRSRLLLTHPPGGTSGHGNLRDFADADERDRWRSSWQRFPPLVVAVVAAASISDPPPPDPSYDQLREDLAVAWHRAGLKVPYDYETPDAQPLDPA